METARKNIETFARNKRVAAAVSGGEDSMALLALLSEYAARGELTLSVVHIDHGLRAESASEAAFVSSYCAERGIPCTVHRIDVAARRAETGRGIEEEARIARREVFISLLRGGEVDLVATAHHALDNAETVLLHLFRGCGLAGLQGMDVLAEGLFRPMLAVSKADIRAYIAAENIPFVVDASNSDTAYDRNYIRHVVLPAVTERFPAAVAAIGRAADWAREADTALRESLEQTAFGRDAYGAVTLDERYARKPYILEALRRLGVTAEVYAPALERIARLPDCRDGARVPVCKGVAAAREYGVIAFYRTDDTKKIAPTPFTRPEAGETRLYTPHGTVVLTETSEPPRFFVPGELYLDMDALPRDCEWRARREGDIFAPFGGGTRKFKEYCIDCKIPRRVRDDLLLLCHGGQVLAAAGVQISDKVRVTEQTRRVLRIRVQSEDVCDE